jgi:hypothetical protein
MQEDSVPPLSPERNRKLFLELPPIFELPRVQMVTLAGPVSGRPKPNQHLRWKRCLIYGDLVDDLPRERCAKKR